MLCLGIFGLELKKNCRIWNQHSRINVIAKFCNKERRNKIWGQNLGIFALEFLKNYCNIWNQRYQICLIGNFLRKQNRLNLGPKMLYLGFFWARIL